MLLYFVVSKSNENVSLVLSDINEKGLQNVALECKKNNCTTFTIPIDLGSTESVEKASREVLNKGIKIDCLYHFAGISQRSLVDETPLFVDRKIFEINFFGAVALTKAVLPHMIKNGGGNIAVTSSIVGKFGFPRDGFGKPGYDCEADTTTTRDPAYLETTEIRTDFPR